MATNTAGTTARENATQQVHYIRKQITETSATTGVIGTVPAGSVFLAPISGVAVNVVFSGTNPTVDIGITGTTQKYASALDLDAALGFVPFDVAVSQKVSVDTQLIYTLVLDTPTTADGDAEIVICYMPSI